jgi:uncharacterized protein (TIGR02594 family)
MFAACPSDFTEYPWLEWAFLALGYGVKQGRDRPVISDFLRYAGLSNAGDDTPWCSGFVNYCIEQSGIRGTRRANARSWLTWGTPLGFPKFGCVAVLWRDNPSGDKGHVGFYTGFQGTQLLLLGGNQSHSVSVNGYPRDRLLQYRWPLQSGRLA